MTGAGKRRCGDGCSVLESRSCSCHLSLIFLLPPLPQKDKKKSVFGDPGREMDKNTEGLTVGAMQGSGFLVVTCSFPSLSCVSFLCPSPEAELSQRRPGACCSGSGNDSHRLSFVKTSFAISTASDWEWLNLGCEFLKFEGSWAFYAFLPPSPPKPKQDIRSLGCCQVRRCWLGPNSSRTGQVTWYRAACRKPLPPGRHQNKLAV